jgi:hypothetical protein
MDAIKWYARSAKTSNALCVRKTSLTTTTSREKPVLIAVPCTEIWKTYSKKKLQLLKKIQFVG